MGPSIATDIIINSKLWRNFVLFNIDTNFHRNFLTLGKWKMEKVLSNIRIYIYFIKFILRHRPNLVLIPISQTSLGYLKDSVFILLSKLLSCKIVLHLRGSNIKNWLQSISSVIRFYAYITIKMGKGVIVLGEKLKYLFSDIFPEDKIFVVPNGANYSHFIFNPDKKIYFNKEKIRILFLSNLIKEKGLFDVLEAIAEIVRFDRNMEAVFAGEWQDKETKIEFNRFAKTHTDLPLELMGPVYGKEKIDLLSSADIFVFPPRESEGHPWVIVEAMAAGLPIITTDQGAITESVKDGLNGFIVEKRNPQQIAEKIKFLIDHPDIRIKMGEESRRLYLENFTEEKMIERLSHAFHSILSRRCAG